MSEEVENPFDESTFATGGGLWDGKVITVTQVRSEVDRLKFADGKPVLNEKTGEPAVRNVLSLTGIADDDENERRETYSSGALIPTPDGEGFVKPDGTPGPFHANSEMAKFSKALKAAGFDIGLLWDGKMHLSKLTGARFRMKGEAQHDKDGNIKKNKKGYEQQKFYPVEFLGFKNGQPAAAAPVDKDALRNKAIEAVIGVLQESAGHASRAEVIRKISSKMGKDPDANRIIALIALDSFHTSPGIPWVKDGTGYRMGA